MKIRLTWDEFVEMATEKMRSSHNVIMPPRFIKTYHVEPEGDMYDFPSVVAFEVSR